MYHKIIAFFLFICFGGCAQKLSWTCSYNETNNCVLGADHIVYKKLQNKQLTTIHLDGLEMERLPIFINELKKLHSLSSWGSQLTSLPQGFFALPSLTTLKLDGHQLDSLTQSINNFQTLKYLSLGSGSLKTLPSALPSSLKELHLTNNLLTQIPSYVFQLEELEALSIDGNSLESISDKISNLQQLKLLRIGRNKELKKLPRIASLGSLVHLDISQLPLIKELPNDFFNQLQLLKKLELNLFKGIIPSSFDQLNQLQYLSADYTNIGKTRMSKIIQCTPLKVLSLEGNNLKNLPNNFSTLKNLTHLTLTNNSFLSFPRSITQLPMLQTLFIGNTDGLHPIYRIQTRGKNSIPQLPTEIERLKHLTRLSLSNCQLKMLPESIGNLSKLKDLYINDNPIRTLPSSLGKLQQLQVLNIHNTNINELPLSLQSLKNLKKIIVSKGKISNLRKLLPPNCKIIAL